ncbi:MAG TPA: TonB-dependent receptor [Myxococcota bacterium]|nr:TonB-dependent receptor [Myxococcota bacterium]
MKSPRHPIILVGPTVMLLFSGHAYAAEGLPELVEVPEIDVSADPVPDKVPVRDSAASDVVVDRSAIESPRGPAAAAMSGPSVLARESGAPGQAVSISIRGSDPRSTLVSLDGIPLNSPFLGGADLNSMTLATLDSISTTRGGQGSLRGSDSTGGTVDVGTPSILDASGFTRAAVLAGSFGTFRMKAAHARLFESRVPVGLMASAGVAHSGGGFAFIDSNGRLRERTHNASTAVEAMAKVESEPAPGHRLDAVVEFFRAHRQIAGLEQFPSETAGQVDTRAIAGLSWRGPRMFGVRGSSNASIWFRSLIFEYSDEAPQFGPPVDTALMSNGFGASAFTLSAPIPRLAIRLGLEGGWVSGQVRRVGQADYRPGRGNVAAVAGLQGGAPSDNWGVGVDVRLEYAGGAGFLAVPGLGAWYEPHRLVRLSANVGRSCRLPTLEELYFDTGYVRGNPELEPEDSITWDIGIEVGRDKWWNFKASYFENHGFNMIMFAPESAFVIRAANSGSATLRGVETSARVEWKWLELSANYTWLYSRLESTGARMPARPEHVFSGLAGFRKGPFRLFLAPSWQSGFFLDTYQSVREEDRFRLDLGLEIRPRPFVVIAVDFLNVTDKKDSIDFVQQPLPGFSAFASVRIEI